MPIISVSLNDKMLEELDWIRREMGFSGRSEAIRAGTRILSSDIRESSSLTGRIKAVLLLIHDHEAENFITNVKHDFLDVIYTQLHNRFRKGKCLEIFILDGEAGRIRGLTRTFRKSDRIDYVKLIVA